MTKTTKDYYTACAQATAQTFTKALSYNTESDRWQEVTRNKNQSGHVEIKRIRDMSSDEIYAVMISGKR